MATDPRLNLLNLSLSLGTTGGNGAQPDSCNTSQQQNLLGTLSANLSYKGFSLSGSASVGSFDNLSVSGGGTVGAGLRGLVSISDTVRLGGKATATATYGLPTTTAGGSNFVLNAVGINSESLSVAAGVNSSVASTANIQAQVVYNQVSQGAFSSSMVTGAFSAFQNAHTLISSIAQLTSGTSPQASNFGALCGAKPYAVDLIRLAPKYKFLFVVQFEFHPDFQNIMSGVDPAFVIKQSARPNIQFEYEDVNQYNFRTKVPKKVVYEPITMKFYDDDRNNVFQFLNAYLKIASPIANIDIEQQKTDPLDAYDIAGGGMGFEAATQLIQPTFGGAVGQGYAASLGPFGVQTDIRNILRKITIFHVYRYGELMNVYNFYNPKITAIQMDELDMTGNDSEIGFTFAYDSVFIIPGFATAGSIGQTEYNLQSITGKSGHYPFGLSAASISASQAQKDGFGLIPGQNIQAQDGVNFGSNTTNLTNSVTSASNSFYANQTAMGSTAASTLNSVAGNTTTNNVVPSPTTGTVPNSADNSSELAAVQADAQQQATGQIAAATATPATTLPESEDQANAVTNINNVANSATSQSSTTSSSDDLADLVRQLNAGAAADGYDVIK